MKKIYTVLISGLLFASYINANAQCTPDPSCMDVLNPGEICPDTLPDGTVGIPYNQIVTVIPPATGAVGSGGTTVPIYKIKLLSVGNMPPGLSYSPNPSSGDFLVTNPITRYCISITGTPTTAGTYALSVHVMPYILVLGYPVQSPGGEVVDDTSLAIKINPTSGYSIINMNKFSLLESKPNPFSYSSKIGFISPSNAEVKLSVFDVIGNLIYKETMISVRGENYFEFDGIKLGKGMYFYSVTNGKESLTKQLIKN